MIQEAGGPCNVRTCDVRSTGRPEEIRPTWTKERRLRRFHADTRSTGKRTIENQRESACISAISVLLPGRLECALQHIFSAPNPPP